MLLRSAGIMGWTGVVGAFALVVCTSSTAAAGLLPGLAGVHDVPRGRHPGDPRELDPLDVTDHGDPHARMLPHSCAQVERFRMHSAGNYGSPAGSMPPARRALLQIHFCVLLWGFTAILGKLISLGALPLVWWRMGIVTAALLLVPRVWRGLLGLSGRLWLAYAGVGAVVSLHWLTFYGAIKLANASVAATCIALAPVFLALVEPYIAGRKFVARELLLGVAVVPGVALVVGGLSPQMRLGALVGGLSALLALPADLPLVCTASVGGIYTPATFSRWARDPDTADLVRFDPADRDERELRVLGPHLAELQRPHRAYVGREDLAILGNAKALVERPGAAARFTLTTVPGDHSSSLQPAIAMYLADILAGRAGA